MVWFVANGNESNMKERHRQVLEKYSKYGEAASIFSHNKTYPDLTRLGKTLATRPLERASKYIAHQRQQNELNRQNNCKLLLCGDSIIKNLGRDTKISSVLSNLNCINSGIGGDRTDHVLWRINDLELPQSIEVVFIHCGTNNILQNFSSPKDTADGILSVGILAKKKLPNAHVIISAVHHLDSSFDSFNQVNKVNKTLKWKAKKCGFVFMAQDCDWVSANDINKQFYASDGIHLNSKGNGKFVNTMIRILKPLPFSSDFSQKINRVPSFEVPDDSDLFSSNSRHPHVSLPPQQHVLSCPSSSDSFLFLETRDQFPQHLPRFSEVPKDVYDHEQRLSSLASSSPVSVTHSFKARPRPRLEKKSPTSCMSLSPSPSCLPPSSSPSCKSPSPSPSSCNSPPTTQDDELRKNVHSSHSSSFLSIFMMVFSFFSLSMLTLHWKCKQKKTISKKVAWWYQVCC